MISPETLLLVAAALFVVLLVLIYVTFRDHRW